MAALSKQRGVELMRWRRGDEQRAYFAGGAVLQNAGRGWKRAGRWDVGRLDDVRYYLTAQGWVKTKSMGVRV